MFLNFANDETPQPNQDWVALNDSARLDRLQEKMGKGSGYENFQPTRAFTTDQHYVSVALDNHIREIERIQPAQGEPPLHVNFL